MGGGLILLPDFQKEGGLTGPPFLEEVCWERRGDIFQRGVGGAIVT